MSEEKPMTVGDVIKKLQEFDPKLPIFTLKDIDFNQFRAGPSIELIQEVNIFETNYPYGACSFMLNGKSAQLWSNNNRFSNGNAVVIWQ